MWRSYTSGQDYTLGTEKKNHLVLGSRKVWSEVLFVRKPASNCSELPQRMTKKEHWKPMGAWLLLGWETSVHAAVHCFFVTKMDNIFTRRTALRASLGGQHCFASRWTGCGESFVKHCWCAANIAHHTNGQPQAVATWQNCQEKKSDLFA